MPRACLPYAREHGMESVPLPCDRDNTGRRKVIEANGGVLEDEREGMLRFWIRTAGRGVFMGMDFEKRPQPPAPLREAPQAEGCLTAVVRIPVRIVVLVLVVPVRMVWDLLAVCGKAVGRALAAVFRLLVAAPLVWLYGNLLVPVAKALGYVAHAVLIMPWVLLWKYVLVPVVRYGIVVPAVWLYRRVLTPAGRGLAWLGRTVGHAVAAAARAVGAAVAWVARMLAVVPLVWLYTYVLTPVGRGLSWLGRTVLESVALWEYVLVPSARGVVWLAAGLWRAVAWCVTTVLVAPLVWLWRAVLVPVGRETAAAFGHAWRIAGYVSRAVGRALKWLGRNLVGRPVRWVWLSVCTPVGHWVRDTLWAPVRRAAVEAGRAAREALRSAREAVRQARRDAWRALVGGPADTRPAGRMAEAVEPVGAPARTLGSKTTAPSAAPASETSLLGGNPAERG
ncbi:hypothetical protein GCM10010446_46620 [Streptomyces enissocaesilis]|uniref:Integral membrane protein n=2 Tax=Streptomyces enissocaesilis TaxID=332589 RepID=A0ABN3XHD7_9ACTN